MRIIKYHSVVIFTRDYSFNEIECISHLILDFPFWMKIQFIHYHLCGLKACNVMCTDSTIQVMESRKSCINIISLIYCRLRAGLLYKEYRVINFYECVYICVCMCVYVQQKIWKEEVSDDGKATMTYIIYFLCIIWYLGIISLFYLRKYLHEKDEQKISCWLPW